MKKVVLICTVLALAMVSPVLAQTTGTRFINFVDTPLTVTYSQYGMTMLLLDGAKGPMNVSGFKKVTVGIGATKATSCKVSMGKITGTTVAKSFDQPINAQNHVFTLDIIGPEMSVWLLGGPSNTTDKVQLWIYLTQ
jgi:hypothetical protein